MRILHILADKGYFSALEILACHNASITATVPRSDTSGARSKGHYVKADFAYDHSADIYRCPAGQALTHRTTTEQQGLQMRRYWTNACKTCALKKHCTTGYERRVSRWEHEHLVEASNARRRSPAAPMSVRRSTVEHPFGTIKSWTGPCHFLTRRLRGRANGNGAERAGLQHQALGRLGRDQGADGGNSRVDRISKGFHRRFGLLQGFLSSPQTHPKPSLRPI